MTTKKLILGEIISAHSECFIIEPWHFFILGNEITKRWHRCWRTQNRKLKPLWILGPTNWWTKEEWLNWSYCIPKMDRANTLMIVPKCVVPKLVGTWILSHSSVFYVTLIRPLSFNGDMTWSLNLFLRKVVMLGSRSQWSNTVVITCKSMKPGNQWKKSATFNCHPPWKKYGKPRENLGT